MTTKSRLCNRLNSVIMLISAQGELNAMLIKKLKLHK